MVLRAEGFSVQADELKDIAARLVKGKADFDESKKPLTDVELPESTFGGTELASALHRGHARARSVMQQTLDGLSADVETFAQALQDLGRVVLDLDHQVKVDIDARTAAVSALEAASHTRTADQRYDDARNDVTGGQPT